MENKKISKSYVTIGALIFVFLVELVVILWVLTHKGDDAVVSAAPVEATQRPHVMAPIQHATPQPSPTEEKPDYSQTPTYFIENKDTLVEQLTILSEDHEAITVVLDNIDHFPKELLIAILSNQEVMDYALNFPYAYPNEQEGGVLTEGEYAEGQIPHLLQWDARWGYHMYANKALGINGCGPTALSMVVIGLTGDIAQTPLKIAEYSSNHYHYEPEVGTKWTLMAEGAKRLGLEPEELPLCKKIILNRLKRNRPIIASMGYGHFTKDTHYIVLAGIHDDGKIIVHDPNSIERSKPWDIDDFINQIRNLWSFKED